ncbi:Solute carrier family 35 member G1 [Holothuria leucospilota]|uniref:Solute carrier family 35 member G1 n=1 Tax=Holothuria leucospilota TaxID=206669 RepID=A0A9Q1C5M7_HOLLE|nr:Solute carrier family 35 member G1 [Holothuria leucospilota]
MEKAEKTNNVLNDHDQLDVEPEDVCRDIVVQPVARDVTDSGDHCISLYLWRQIFKHRALLYVVVAAFCAALESILVRYVSKDVHAIQVSFTRFLLLLPVPASVLTYRGISPKADSKLALALLIIRGLVGTFSLTAFYYALYFADIGNATAVLYGSPVFVVFFARIILKEAIGIIDAVLALTVIGGVVLISQPPFLFAKGEKGDDWKELIGVLLALCACITLALAITITAKMGKLRVSSFKIVFYYSIVASVTTASLTTIIKAWSIPPCGSVRFALVGMGILSCSHQCLQTYSLSKENSVLVTIVRTNEVIFAYALQFLFFDTSPSTLSLIGAGLIMAGSITASWRKMRVKGDVANQRGNGNSSHRAEGQIQASTEL